MFDLSRLTRPQLVARITVLGRALRDIEQQFALDGQPAGHIIDALELELFHYEWHLYGVDLVLPEASPDQAAANRAFLRDVVDAHRREQRIVYDRVPRRPRGARRDGAEPLP